MCGIVAKINFGKNKKVPVNNDILQQYDKQASRGQQGFGLFDGQYQLIIRDSREDAILKWLVHKDSNFIMFHHRFPTSTVNVARAAHPFSTHDYFGDTQYIMVHNGVIRNADDLWIKHNDLGIRYSSLLEDLTFNDSEALLWDLALTMEGKQDAPVAYGDMAFIMVKKVKNKIVDVRYGRNSRPLNIFHDDGTLELSSEGRGVPIFSNTLHIWDPKKNTVEKEGMTFQQYKPFPQSIGSAPFVQKGGTHTYSTATRHAHATTADYDSYDEYYESRYGGGAQLPLITAGSEVIDREANWQRLREKYGQPIGSTAIMTATDDNVDQLNKDIAEVLESERLEQQHAESIASILSNHRGKLIPLEVRHDQAVDIARIDVRDYEPTSGEVQALAMEYMIQGRGVFEDAYMLLENEYSDFLEEVAGKETFDDIRSQLLMEGALEFINKDAEYVSDNSVSSIWEALWGTTLARA